MVIADQAAPAIAVLANQMSQRKSMTDSAKEVLLVTLAKVADAYSTSLFRPIPLLNTDYKIIMRVWANRLGPILNEIIRSHQKGFIPSKDDRENVIHAQLVLDLCKWKGRDGGFLFMDA